MPPFTVPVTVLSVVEQKNSYFSLNCTSTGSPPTFVTWLKDGAEMDPSNYLSTQNLVDSLQSTYSNSLVVFGEPGDILGIYTCAIRNIISSQTVATASFDGMCQPISVIVIIKLILNYRHFNI